MQLFVPISPGTESPDAAFDAQDVQRLRVGFVLVESHGVVVELEVSVANDQN